MRHIAINGMSFCGSTILSYVLGSLPECANIGESHWLVDLPRDASSPRQTCHRCGPACRVLTDTLREELRLCESDGTWYGRIAQALHTETLISSDKDSGLLDRLDPARERHELVLFKRPDRALLSHERATGRQDLGKWYGRAYSAQYGSPPEISGTRNYLFLDDFLANPPEAIAALSSALSLKHDHSALQYWEHPHHTIGGNFNPYAKPEKREIVARPVVATDHVDRFLTASDLDPLAWSAFDRMMAHPGRIKV